MRSGLWAEAARYCCDLENMLVTNTKKEPSYNKFYGKNLMPIQNIRIFGEVGYVNDGSKIKNKLKDRSMPCLCLGKAPDHSSDTYRVFKLDTWTVVNNQNITWMDKVYGDWKHLSAEDIKHYEDDKDELEVFDEYTPMKDPEESKRDVAVVSDDDEEEAITEPGGEEGQGNVKQNPNARLIRTLRQIKSDYNPEATAMLEKFESANILLDRYDDSLRYGLDEFAFVAFGEEGRVNIEKMLAEWKNKPPQNVPEKYRKDIFEAPTTFQEAWNHPCEFQKKLWREAIRKELNKMINMDVFKKIHKSEIPQ